MYKYVNMLWFFFVFLQGCENHIFPFIQAEFPRNTRSRWRDWSEWRYRKGEGTSLPVFQASVSQIILIVAPPIQHFHEIRERWSGKSESNTLCQIRATLFRWSNLIKGKEAFDERSKASFRQDEQTDFGKQIKNKWRAGHIRYDSAGQKEKLWKLGKRNQKNRVSESVHDACVCVWGVWT